MSVRALGHQKVTALTLPERDITPQKDIKDVMELCEAFEVTCEHVEITPMLRVMRKNIPQFDSDDRVVYGNMKARLRMLLATTMPTNASLWSLEHQIKPSYT